MDTTAQAPDRNTGDVALAFASLLLQLGRGEPIRCVEAIAATIANQLRSAPSDPRAAPACFADPEQSRQHCLARRLAALAAPFDATPMHAKRDDVAYASCLRITRRAIAGALADPTGGATRFHSVDETPRWSRGRLPCTTIGGFVFYRDEPSLLNPEPGDQP